MMLCLSAKAQQFDVQLVPHIYTGGTHITCHGQSNGQVAAIITGGQAPYKIFWSTGDTTNSISGLPAGSYSVMVHDAAYDTLHRQITLTQPASLAVQYSTSSYNGYAVAWQGAANAQMQVLPTGGVAPYKILWSDGDSSIIRSNMSVGTYQFTITDAAGCSTQGSKQLTAPDMLQGTVQVLQGLSCADEADARAVVQASGGVPPYSYNWKHGEMGDTAWSILAGKHFVSITDANQKTIQVLFEIQEPEPLEVRAKAFVYANRYNTSCHNCANGKIMTNVTGGTAPYTYAWYNDEEELISTESNPEQLEAGKYYLSVYDAHQCKAKSGAHILPAPRDDWSMEGNEGLDAASHFIGTTDSTALVFRTNHQEAMRIEGDGDIEIEKGFKLKQLADPDLSAEKYQVPLLRSDGSFEIPSAWKIEYNPIQSRPCVRPADIAAWQFAATGETAADYDPEKIVYYGKVGINICNPTEELHVNGNATISNLLRAERVIAGEVAQFSSTSTVHISQIGNQPALFTKGASQENYNSLHRYSSSNAYTKVIASENQSDETFVVYGDGTTVIGAGTGVVPGMDTKLAVDGQISARKIKVTQGNFPDYVFEKDYKAMSAEEIEKYIEANGHLPGVMSACDVEENGGFELGELSLQSLEKIEELYLLIIEMEKRLKALEEENILLKNKSSK